MNRRGFSKTLASTLIASAAARTASWGKGALRQPAELDQLVGYDALGLAGLLKKKEVTPLEIVDVVIRRIEALDPALNFMTTRAYERAREKANSIPLDSRFAGVPILIKDMVDVGGVRRTDGSRLLATNIPKENVKYIDGVERAGLNIVGMTNVPELAGGLTTDNDLFGATRNPWNLNYFGICIEWRSGCCCRRGHRSARSRDRRGR